MQHRFSMLFAMLLAMILLYPTLQYSGGSQIVAKLLLTAMYLAAFQVLYADRSLRSIKVIIAAVAVLGSWLGFILPGVESAAPPVVFHIFAAVFQTLVLVVVLRNIYRDRSITPDAIFAALCGYILMGVVFGHIYCVLESLVPGSFHGDGVCDHPGRNHIALSYFSFVTLATVGFGDVLPATRQARCVAIVEAMLGQFYIAVLLADLIGKRVSQSMFERRD